MRRNSARGGPLAPRAGGLGLPREAEDPLGQGIPLDLRGPLVERAGGAR